MVYLLNRTQSSLGCRFEVTKKVKHGITLKVNSRTFVHCIMNFQILVQIPEEK